MQEDRILYDDIAEYEIAMKTWRSSLSDLSFKKHTLLGEITEGLLKNPEIVLDDDIKRKIYELEDVNLKVDILAKPKLSDSAKESNKSRDRSTFYWVIMAMLLTAASAAGGVAAAFLYLLERIRQIVDNIHIINSAFAQNAAGTSIGTADIDSNISLRTILLVTGFLFLIINSFIWSIFLMRTSDAKKAQFAQRMVESTVTLLIGAIAGFLSQGTQP